MGGNNSRLDDGRDRSDPALKIHAMYKRFYMMCEEGDLTRVTNFITKNDICLRDNNTPLLLACSGGHVRLANWLFIMMRSESADIHRDDDALFKKIVLHSPIRIVKWILSHDIFDYRRDDDDIFHKLCYRNKVEIAQYFESICRDYRLELEIKNRAKDVYSHDDFNIVDYHIMRGEITDRKIITKLGFKPENSSKVVDTMEDCPICLDENTLGVPIILQCGHSLCLSCFFRWYYELKNSHKCSICMQRFRYYRCRYVDGR